MLLNNRSHLTTFVLNMKQLASYCDCPPYIILLPVFFLLLVFSGEYLN